MMLGNGRFHATEWTLKCAKDVIAGRSDHHHLIAKNQLRMCYLAVANRHHEMLLEAKDVG